jgi:hypothetical protein
MTATGPPGGMAGSAGRVGRRAPGVLRVAAIGGDQPPARAIRGLA